MRSYRKAPVLLWVVAVATIAFLTVPVIISVIGSFAGAWHKSLIGDFTLEWYKYVLDNYSRTIGISLLIGFLCMGIGILIGVPAAYAFAKYDFPGKTLFEQIVALPMAMPGIALAVAIIQTHSDIRGHWYFVLLGHLVVTLPYMVDTVAAALRGFNMQVYEESAASLGASWWQRFVHVVVPNVRQAIISGALMIFTISLGEFNMTLFLYTPMYMTLPIGLYESYASLRLEIGSAYTSIFLVLIIPVLVAIQYLGAADESELKNI